MTTNVLSAIQQTFADRAAKRAAEQSEALKRIRQIVFSIATGEDPQPTDDEVITALDQLGEDHVWLTGAVGIAVERGKQVEGMISVPGLKEQATKLESEAAKLVTECEAAKAAFDYALLQCKNVDGMTFSPWRNDVTSDELKKRRDTHLAWTELCDDHWLATRDAAELRKEIAKLEKVDQSLIDPASGEQPGRDFRLPPLS